MRHGILTTLCHVAAQLAQRWNPIPSDLASAWGMTDQGAGAIFDPLVIEESHWGESIRQLVDASLQGNHWLSRYFGVLDPGGEKLRSALLAHLKAVQAAGALHIGLSDPRYPDLLRHMSDPPLGLTIWGAPELLSRPMVSVVGSRKGSGLAVQQSYRLGRLLAEAGLVTVSGGALGCDAASHWGALSLDLRPAPVICVMAGGLCRLYPAMNAAFFRKLQNAGGVLMSERLWYAMPRRWDFPVRNRLIAGLSGLTAVMQAGRPSGAYVTARLANKEGRDVAVLEHPPYDIRAEGSQSLIDDGAFRFASAEQLIARIVPCGR